MRLRDRLADWISGGELKWARRSPIFRDPDREFKFGVALCAIRDMETDGADHIAKRMARIARDALQ